MFFTVPDQSRGKLVYFLDQSTIVTGTWYSRSDYVYIKNNPWDWGLNMGNMSWLVTDGQANTTIYYGLIQATYDGVPPIFLGPTSGSCYQITNVTLGFTFYSPDGRSCVMLINSYPAHGDLFDEKGNNLTFFAPSILTLSGLNVHNLSNPHITYVPRNGFEGADSYSVDVDDGVYTLTNKPIISISVTHHNTPPTITSSNYTTSCCSPQVTLFMRDIVINDDASTNNGVIEFNITNFQHAGYNQETAMLSIMNTSGSTLLFQGGVNNAGYRAPIRSINVNLQSPYGLQYIPRNNAPTNFVDYTVNFTISVSDLGQFGDGGPLNVTKLVFITVHNNFGGGSPALQSSGFIIATAVLSAAVFVVYVTLKKKRIIPEEIDPWENDEVFDVTSENPLFTGPPGNLEPMYELN